MRLTYIFTSLMLVLRCIALVMLAPVFVAIYYNDWKSIIPFVTASLICFVLSFIFNEQMLILYNFISIVSFISEICIHYKNILANIKFLCCNFFLNETYDETNSDL